MYYEHATGGVHPLHLNYGATPIYTQIPRGVDPYLDYRGHRYSCSDIAMMSDSPARVQALLRARLGDPHLIGAKMVLVTHRERSLSESVQCFHGRYFGYFAILAVTEADEVLALRRKREDRTFAFQPLVGTPL